MIVKATTAFRNSGIAGPYGNKAWQDGEEMEVVGTDPVIVDNIKAGYLVEVTPKTPSGHKAHDEFVADRMGEKIVNAQEKAAKASGK